MFGADAERAMRYSQAELDRHRAREDAPFVDPVFEKSRLDELASDASARGLLPAQLDDMPAGPDLAAALAKVDREHLNGYEVVVLMRAHARLIAHYEAQLLADMVELGYCPSGDALSPTQRVAKFDEEVMDELRAALAWTRRRADVRLGLALGLVERLPRVWDALDRGVIDSARAWVFRDEVANLDTDTARVVCDRLLDRPELESWTTGQLRARLRRLVLEVNPDQARQKREAALTERRVVTWPNPNGTADLIAESLPPERVAAIMERIERIARRQPKDGRSMDQRRADTLMDILEGKHADAGRGVVAIDVDLPTLMGLADRPAELDGWGPVIADVARRVAHGDDSQWQVTVWDPDTGAILHSGLTRRRPTNRQKQYLIKKLRTCRFPACRTPARRCDIDHTVPAGRGGPTLIENEGPLCEHDHTVKTRGRWSHSQPSPGVHEWTSPHGHTYTIHPPDPP